MSKESISNPVENKEKREQQQPYQVFWVETVYGVDTPTGKLDNAIIVVGPDGKIISVSSGNEEATAMRDVQELSQGDFVETKHEVIIPALTDAHNHPILYGSIYEQGPAFIFGIHTPEGLAQAVREQMKGKAGLQVAIGWDTSTLKNVDRSMLDEIREEPFFVVDTSYHGAVGNTKAMALMEDYVKAMGLEGKIKGEMKRDGNLKEEYVILCFELMERGLDLDNLVKSAEGIIDRTRQAGTLYVHDMNIATPAQLEMYRSLSAVAKDSIRIAHISPRMLRYAVSQGLDVSQFSLKLIADGSNSSRTALYYEPYLGSDIRGIKYHSEVDALEAMKLAADHGILRVATHAIGDKGIDVAIAYSDLWQGIAQSNGLDGMARIEHMSVPTDEAIKLAAERGLSVAPQPNFIPDVIPMNDRFDKRRLEGMVPLRKMLDSGMRVMLGTDGMPNSMTLALHCALQAPYIDQRINLQEAIHSATATAPEYEGAARGKIAVGMPADFLITNKLFIDKLGGDQGLYRATKEELSANMDEIANDLESRVEEVRQQGRIISQK